MNYPSKEFIEEFKKTPGALSVCESIAIYNIALQSPEGLYLELGSHKGKSGMSAALGLKAGLFYLVDPIFEDTTIASDVSKLVRGVNDKVVVVMVNDYSTNIIEKHSNLSYVMIDSGSHQDGLPMQEVKMLEDRVKQNGIIAFHDFRNQFREPAEAAEYLVSTGKYEWVDIDWDAIVNYVKENNLEQGNNSWHIYDDRPFPCFVGAVRRK
jgi:predicted O-methyltransferase YrrM